VPAWLASARVQAQISVLPKKKKKKSKIFLHLNFHEQDK
jgi:hypothetical protein